MIGLFKGSQDQHGVRRDLDGLAQISARPKRPPAKFRSRRRNRFDRKLRSVRERCQQQRKLYEASKKSARRQRKRLPRHALVERSWTSRSGGKAAHKRRDVAPSERLRKRASSHPPRKRLRNAERPGRRFEPTISVDVVDVKNVAESATPFPKHRFKCQKIFEKLLRRNSE